MITLNHNAFRLAVDAPAFSARSFWQTDLVFVGNEHRDGYLPDTFNLDKGFLIDAILPLLRIFLETVLLPILRPVNQRLCTHCLESIVP